MKKYSLGERFRYSFDNIMSRGTAALIGWLAIISVILIVGITFIISISNIGPEDKGFVDVAWMGMMRTLDAGTMGADDQSYTGNWPFLLSMFAITLSGVFVISILIGLLTTGIESKLDALRKGRSRIIEHNHTVILGWSEQIFTLISELCVANENQKRPCIAILAERDKVEMEDEIRQKVGKTRNTRVVCRTGSSMDLPDLELVSIHSSRSIIVLSPDEKDNPDSDEIKTILAITNNPNRREEPYHIVAEIRDPRNMEVARMVGKDEVELVLIGNLIARIIAQTCRQSGLSVVYSELMDFDGDEIYFKNEPSTAGMTFGETFLLYNNSTVIGLKPEGQIPLLNPPLDTIIGKNDELVVVTGDDDTTVLSGLTNYGIDENNISTITEIEPTPEHVLILGWNWRATAIISELDNYVAPGSVINVIADFEDGMAEIENNCTNLSNSIVTFKVGDTTDRRILDSLSVPTYNHVILLCYSDELNAQDADARTLITLLHLRDISDNSGHTFSIVSEMLDIRNRTLAEVTRADDFIVSDRLVSLMLSQISENKNLNAVFADIFDAEGSEIYLKPTSRYVKTGVDVNFYTVIEAARRKNEIAIGYRIKAFSTDADKAYGVVVNPDKSQMIRFSEEDKIIVIAED